MATTQYQIFCRYFNGDINRCVTSQTPVEWVSNTELSALKKYCYDTTVNPATGKTNAQLYAELVNSVTGRTNPVRWVKDFSIPETECWTNFKRMEELEALDYKNLLAREIVQIEPADEMVGSNVGILRRLKAARDLAHYDTIAEQINVSNPKYDMIFMYDGIGQVKGPVFIGNQENEDYGQFDTSSTAYLYCRNASGGDSHQQPYAYYDNMKRVKYDIWFEHSIHASLRSAMAKANELVNIVGKANVKIGKVVPLDKYIEIV